MFNIEFYLITSPSVAIASPGTTICPWNGFLGLFGGSDGRDP